MAEADDAGTWRDVYALHFLPSARKRTARFERDVGSEGYDRHTGVDVPKAPVLRGPRDKEPVADPFADEKH